MAKSHKKSNPERSKNVDPIPFDDALRKILKAPPQHKKAKKKAGKKR